MVTESVSRRRAELEGERQKLGLGRTQLDVPNASLRLPFRYAGVCRNGVNLPHVSFAQVLQRDTEARYTKQQPQAGRWWMVAAVMGGPKVPRPEQQCQRDSGRGVHEHNARFT